MDTFTALRRIARYNATTASVGRANTIELAREGLIVRLDDCGPIAVKSWHQWRVTWNGKQALEVANALVRPSRAATLTTLTAH
jgi:hypothetical protein